MIWQSLLYIYIRVHVTYKKLILYLLLPGTFFLKVVKVPGSVALARDYVGCYSLTPKAHGSAWSLRSKEKAKQNVQCECQCDTRSVYYYIIYDSISVMCAYANASNYFVE